MGQLELVVKEGNNYFTIVSSSALVEIVRLLAPGFKDRHALTCKRD